MYRKILVTGGCGFIGSHFIRLLLHDRPSSTIVNLDNLSHGGDPANLADITDQSRYEFRRGDLTDATLVGSLVEQCDCIVHLAAETHVDRSIRNPKLFFETNVLGTQTLLEALRNAPGKRFVHVSTDEVYGSLDIDAKDMKFTEAARLNPANPYAASKAASDLLAFSYYQTFGLNIVVTRSTNNFGSHQSPDKFIPLFITNILEGKNLPLYGDGHNVRDWLHVVDHCNALLAVLERGASGEIYNIGANNEHSNINLTRTLLALMDAKPSMIEYVADRQAHDRRYAVDSRKITEELGWRAKHTIWPAALRSTIEWYVGNENWWRGKKAE